MNKPKRIDLSQKELDALIERVEAGALLDSDREIIKAMAETISILSHAVDEKSASIKRLLKMIFGGRTEKTAFVLKHKDTETSSPGEDKKSGGPVKKKPKGHGRNGAASYSGADKVKVHNEELKPKDTCPKCLKGKLYEVKVPKTVVRITGKSPLHATVFQMQKLRCNLCGEIFTAEEPPGIGQEKYDAESGAMIALLKYGSGLPFNRLEQLQASLGVPLPSSTQWDIVESVADKIHPVFTQFQFQAAQGEVVYNDDTIMKVLELMKENEDASRKGMFSSGILSTVGHRKIALFFTGRKHAGENLEDILAKRKPGIKAPIQMCDALSRNFSGDFNTLLANCLAHGRRNFVDIAWNFPEQCKHVLEELKKVYKNDALAKQKELTPDERLAFHQKRSKPIMDNLSHWFNAQFEDKKVEPNSGLGKAIKYMQKHWKELTLFLRESGAPLDNNLCEQALKKAILHRKNSLFYKTKHGAYVGDLFMSLIHTCTLCKVNPFDYLTELQKHSSALFENSAQWLPWNYKDALGSVQ
jgi:transposase